MYRLWNIRFAGNTCAVPSFAIALPRREIVGEHSLYRTLESSEQTNSF